MPPKRPPKQQKEIEQKRMAQAARLERVIEHLEIASPRKFFDSLGIIKNTEMYYRAKEGRRDFNMDFYKRLRNTYPQINTDWIKDESGNMLNDGQAIVSEAPVTYGSNTNQFIVTDNSMADFFLKGDTVISSPVLKDSITVFGEVYLVEDKSGNKLLRYLWLKNDDFVLKANQPERSPDIVLQKTDVKSIHRLNKLIRQYL